MKKIQSNQSAREIKKSSEMSRKELCNWFAFCNCLKFINLQSSRSGIEIKEIDIDTRHIQRYIKSVSGDLEYSLKHKNGIPYKYSLDIDMEEAMNTNEIIYT